MATKKKSLNFGITEVNLIAEEGVARVFIKDDRDDYRSSRPRDRSPGRRDVFLPQTVRSRSNSSGKNFSPDRVKGHSQLKVKSSVASSHTPSGSTEESPPNSASLKDKPTASVPESKEVVDVSMEPEGTPEKVSRLEAIKTKAQEIETDFRNDCETFRTVVKMLVNKEPSLEDLLQSALDKNLTEMKDRCLDALKTFMTEVEQTKGETGSSK